MCMFFASWGVDFGTLLLHSFWGEVFSLFLNTAKFLLTFICDLIHSVVYVHVFNGRGPDVCFLSFLSGAWGMRGGVGVDVGGRWRYMGMDHARCYLCLGCEVGDAERKGGERCYPILFYISTYTLVDKK